MIYIKEWDKFAQVKNISYLCVMKNLLIILMLMIATSSSAQHFGKKYRKENFTEIMGWGVAGGGALLTIGVAVTPMEYRRKQPVGWEPTPYWNQTAQMAGLTTGIVLTGTGLITALVTRKGNGRYKRRR